MVDPQTYWNEIGSKKDFEDPLYLEKLTPFLKSDSKIVEYGCGYGRLLSFLQNKGYSNLVGYDYAPNMIKRGMENNPELSLFHIKESGKIPLKTHDADLVILSTVLCCIPEQNTQAEIIDEIKRILKPNGVLYLSDFLINAHPSYRKKYDEGLKKYNDYGIYTTSDHLAVRHHTTTWMMKLLEAFDIQWMEQFDFKTMNGNPARTLHCIAQSIPDKSDPRGEA